MTQPQSLLTLARRAVIALGWNHPFFAIPGARVRIREDPSGARCDTACVTADGVIYLYPPWCAALKPAELQGLIAHELMHLLMLHHNRRGTRIPLVFNIACDMTINHALKVSGITLSANGVDDGVYPPTEWETWHAERIYDELIQNATQPQAGDGAPAPGQGCGVQGPSGEGADTDGEAAPSDAELERRWREIAVQASEMGRTQGKGKDDALVGALEIPEPRVNWGAILRRGMATAISAHGRDAQTWSRRGRRSQTIGPQFAGWQTNAAACAVVIDTSGSMSDDDLAQCVAETVSISRASGVNVYLVTHDAAVQWAGWLTAQCAPAAVKPALTGRGGTDASGAYENVAGAARRFDAFIHLTDGELFWPPWPANVRQKVVALVGYQGDANDVPEGARVIEVNNTGN